MRSQTTKTQKSQSRTVGRSDSPYRTKPNGVKSAVGQAAASAAVQFRTVSSMQDDGNSIQREAIDAAVLTAESAEAKRAKQRQKERYKKQYASPYYEKRRTATGKETSKTGQQSSNQPQIKKKKKSSISPAKSVQRFIIVLIGSLMLVVLLFCVVTLPVLLPFTIVGEEEETETEEITEEVSTDEQETFEMS